MFNDYKYHNPFFKARNAYNARRSFLFTTAKRWTPGLTGKFGMGYAIFGFMYGSYQLRKYKFERDRAKTVEWEFKRKATPFLQAIEDRRANALAQRREWLFAELFKGREEELLYLRRLYNDPTIGGVEFRKCRGDIQWGGVKTSYKGYSRATYEFAAGRDMHAKNVASEHY